MAKLQRNYVFNFNKIILQLLENVDKSTTEFDKFGL